VKEFGGWFFPDQEAHITDWMQNRNAVVDGRLTYQHHKLSAALEHVNNFGVAVDVGAHIGTWAYFLAKRFKQLQAFEPMEQFRECFSRNVQSDNVVLHPVALGAENGLVLMVCDPKDTGGTHVALGQKSADRRDEKPIEMRTLDGFALHDVGFVKIDAEGFEHHIIAGARETLLRCKPCVVVEQKGHIMQRNYGTAGTPAVDLLKEMGAEVRACISGDYILTW
jgi:FkbM family methyltransferase